jgi:hypothetical protein
MTFDGGDGYADIEKCTKIKHYETIRDRRGIIRIQDSTREVYGVAVTGRSGFFQAAETGLRRGAGWSSGL